MQRVKLQRPPGSHHQNQNFQAAECKAELKEFKEACLKGIASVRKNAQGAKIVEE